MKAEDEQDKIKNWLARQARNHEDGIIHERWHREYKSGGLIFPEPTWHLEAEHVDLSHQEKCTDKRLLTCGVAIIKQVEIESLFEQMTTADAAFFRRKKMYEYSGDRKTSRILEEWKTGTKLIPPFMMIFDEDFKQTLSLERMITSTEIMPQDGKHRLNAAYCGGFTHIPILVRSIQFDKIKQMLSID